MATKNTINHSMLSIIALVESATSKYEAIVIWMQLQPTDNPDLFDESVDLLHFLLLLTLLLFNQVAYLHTYYQRRYR